MQAEPKAERRVWNLLVGNLTVDLPARFGVKVHGRGDSPPTDRSFQIFEVIVAAIFANLRPDYEWAVTPAGADDGLDFVGTNRFLNDDALGIAAAITAGGQCKKSSGYTNVERTLSDSLVRMADQTSPTFFIVALSAHVPPERLDAARARFERVLQRTCHILDRPQIEGLMRDHLPVVEDIIREGLTEDEVGEIVDYFEGGAGYQPSVSVGVTAPKRVRAGTPFTVTVSVRSLAVSRPGMRLWWRPHEAEGERRVELIGPVDADGPAGIELATATSDDDPILSRHSIELITYAVGKVDLGHILLGHRDGGPPGADERIELGHVRVIENVRPRFFERPFRPALARLGETYDRALTGSVEAVGVVGAGGSGKSRLCEEFALERRRRGANVVAAKQAKTLNDPHRILADLFRALAPPDIAAPDPAERAIKAVERYDPALAARAESAIRSIFGITDGAGGVVEQDTLSTLVLLIIARARQAPLIVHLQDLHWCTADVLLLLEQLVWQLDQIATSSGDALAGRDSGVLFIFEGRIRERQELGVGGWVSEPFEAFLRKLQCTIVRCSSFTPEDGLEFIRRLFEDRYSARRLISDDLLDLQQGLVERIDRSAGGNPFHSLEQVQLLKERGVLGQNPDTGFLYLIQPAPSSLVLPDSVFEAIQLRWRYLKTRTPALALLVWAAALLEDRVSALLFRRLWREIAPDVSLADIDATEILWTGEGENQEVAFRHEHYFRSIRRFEVSTHERRRIVEIYSSWFAEAKRRDPADDFSWARVLLELPEPDVDSAEALMDAALRGARRAGNLRLARRIAATSIDLTWTEDGRSAMDITTFLQRCDEDLALIRELLNSDRFQATNRLDGLRARLGRRLESDATQSVETALELQRRQLTAEVLRSQILYNDRQPAIAAEVSARALKAIQALRAEDPANDEAWDLLEMEALHSQAVALALSGEIDEALETSERAVATARRTRAPVSHKIISTYGNILLARDPAASESILRQCLADVAEEPELTDLRHAIEINLSMALVLRAYALGVGGETGRALLAEARERLGRVFTSSFQVDTYPQAGAAALMLGIVSALQGEPDAVTWFAQAVAAASRGHKMETLWRAYINLATAGHQAEGRVTETVRDHARAALEIMEETLSSYSQPDRSARFELIRVPLAQAVRFLLLAGDEAGRAALIRYPTLRASFEDMQTGVLRDERGAPRSHEWLRIGGEDYVIY